eukprot:951508-Rhodomonas_salina.1
MAGATRSISTEIAHLHGPSVQGSAAWKTEQSSYWTLANDLARRIERSGYLDPTGSGHLAWDTAVMSDIRSIERRTRPEDYRSADYDPQTAPPSKLSIAYVMENAIRVLVPAFETA